MNPFAYPANPPILRICKIGAPQGPLTQLRKAKMGKNREKINALPLPRKERRKMWHDMLKEAKEKKDKHIPSADGEDEFTNQEDLWTGGAVAKKPSKHDNSKPHDKEKSSNKRRRDEVRSSISLERADRDEVPSQKKKSKKRKKESIESTPSENQGEEKHDLNQTHENDDDIAPKESKSFDELPSDPKQIKKQRQKEIKKKRNSNRTGGGFSKRVRDLKRLLRKENLDPSFRKLKEDELRELEIAKVEAAKDREKRRIRNKYKMVSFFELRKVNRHLNQAQRALNNLTEDADEKTRSELEEEVKKYEKHLIYIKYFPMGEKYISLYRDINETESAKRSKYMEIALEKALQTPHSSTPTKLKSVKQKETTIQGEESEDDEAQAQQDSDGSETPSDAPDEGEEDDDFFV